MTRPRFAPMHLNLQTCLNRQMWRLAGIAALTATVFFASPANAQSQSPPGSSLNELLDSVVLLKTYVNPDAQSASSLGHERTGSGIIIDDSGLILTIGYLMAEAYSAEIVTNSGRKVAVNTVGYDPDTGFGLMRAAEPLKIKPMPFGKSSDVKVRDQVLAASFGGVGGVAPAFIASKRPFAGNWEYLLDETFFTMPAHNLWSGAALINREGKLVGVGSLVVGDASGKGDGVPGNMYVPTDLLTPILADLISDGRSSRPARPWLGVTTNDTEGLLTIGRVTPGSPAAKAGLQRGDVITGVAGQPTKTLPDFYRKVWAQGTAGVTVPLDVTRNGAVQHISVQSVDRLQNLKLKSTL